MAAEAGKLVLKFIFTNAVEWLINWLSGDDASGLQAEDGQPGTAQVEYLPQNGLYSVELTGE